MKDEKMKLTVEMEVTKAQALSLMAMFRYWNSLASVGSSRYVGFYVDGDGSFHPKCKVTTEPYLELTDEMYTFAPMQISKDPKQNIANLNLSHGDALFDYDKIAWKLEDEKP